jgi:hypothetical protein
VGPDGGPDFRVRITAWRAHLLHDQGPIQHLMPQLELSYADEISSLSDARQSREVELRHDRRGDYLALLYLLDAPPPALLDGFLRTAPARLRQRVMWFVGVQMQQQLSSLSDHHRQRAKSYWATRLHEAAHSPTPMNIARNSAASVNGASANCATHPGFSISCYSCSSAASHLDRFSA